MGDIIRGEIRTGCVQKGRRQEKVEIIDRVVCKGTSLNEYDQSVDGLSHKNMGVRMLNISKDKRMGPCTRLTKVSVSISLYN